MSKKICLCGCDEPLIITITSCKKKSEECVVPACPTEEECVVEEHETCEFEEIVCDPSQQMHGSSVCDSILSRSAQSCRSPCPTPKASSEKCCVPSASCPSSRTSVCKESSSKICTEPEPEPCCPPPPPPLLPCLCPRYHGPGCAMEVSIFEKHASDCKYRKRPNPCRNREDRCGSYEAIGRLTFQTCGSLCCESEMTRAEPTTSVYRFSETKTVCLAPSTNEEMGQFATQTQIQEPKLVKIPDPIMKQKQMEQIQQLLKHKEAVETLTNCPKTFNSGFQRPQKPSSPLQSRSKDSLEDVIFALDGSFRRLPGEPIPELRHEPSSHKLKDGEEIINVKECSRGSEYSFHEHIYPEYSIDQGSASDTSSMDSAGSRRPKKNFFKIFSCFDVERIHGSDLYLFN